VLIEAAADMLGDSIVLAHAKDRLSNGSFAASGAGVLDYRHYLSVMRKLGFNGALITHDVAADKAEQVAQFLKTEITAVETGR
jgi:sugar phosphate isomerase/epimerase